MLLILRKMNKAAPLHDACRRWAADRGPARRHVCRACRSPSPWCIFPGKPCDSQSLLSEAPGAGKSKEMASPRTITLVALSFALGLFFVFMGTIKLTPRLSKDAYSEMVSIDILAIVVQGHCSVGYRRLSRSGLNNDRRVDLNYQIYR